MGNIRYYYYYLFIWIIILNLPSLGVNFRLKTNYLFSISDEIHNDIDAQTEGFQPSFTHIQSTDCVRS